MSWTPMLQVDNSSPSLSETIKQLHELQFRSSITSALDSINKNLILLNSRVEEAFETDIEVDDDDCD